jgi:hypothetical protein
MLPPPTFHHLHLNSLDPDAAIEFYTTHFPSSQRTTWNGDPALACANAVTLLEDSHEPRARRTAAQVGAPARSAAAQYLRLTVPSASPQPCAVEAIRRADLCRSQWSGRFVAGGRVLTARREAGFPRQ